MTEKEHDKRVSVLQYINTFLLAMISLFFYLGYQKLDVVAEKQQKTSEDIVVMKAVQDRNVKDINDISIQLSTHVTGDATYKMWVDQTYSRKLQK